MRNNTLHSLYQPCVLLLQEDVNAICFNGERFYQLNPPIASGNGYIYYRTVTTDYDQNKIIDRMIKNGNSIYNDYQSAYSIIVTWSLPEV